MNSAQLDPLPSDFECPDNMKDHLRKVFAGEYDIPIHKRNETDEFHILDLGANCGAFAIWASRRWPGCVINAYEPNPETFKSLTANILRNDDCRIHAHQVAVTGTAPGTTKLFLGRNNCGEATLIKNGASSDNAVEVPTIPPEDLPFAHIIKLDIEGSELEVLHSLISVQNRSYSAIMLEWHSEPIRRMLDALLIDYVPIKMEVATPGRGTVCYVNLKLLSQKK